jgi:hypothetical protein
MNSSRLPLNLYPKTAILNKSANAHIISLCFTVFVEWGSNGSKDHLYGT